MSIKCLLVLIEDRLTPKLISIKIKEHLILQVKTAKMNGVWGILNLINNRDLELKMAILVERVEELNRILVEFGHESNEVVVSISHMIAKSFMDGGKVLICGNGGSAADAQHFAAEFVSSFSKDLNRRALPALALTTDTSIITAYSNDFGYEGVFARQVEAFGVAGDVLIVISTSGNSSNCIKAVEKAIDLNMQTVAFTGEAGALKGIVNYNLSVPSNNTQHIQEAHMIAYHVICEIVEKELFIP